MSIRVVVFNAPVAPTLAPAILYHHQVPDAGTPPAQEAFHPNPHVAGRFKATQYKQYKYNYEGSDFSGVLPAQESAHPNPNFIGKFKAPQFKHSFSFTIHDGNASVVVVAETNTHFIGKYFAPKYKSFQYNFSSFDGSDTSAPQPDTAAAVVGKFNAPKLKQFGYNSRAVDESAPLGAQPDSPSQVVGRFVAPKYRQFIFSSPSVEDQVVSVTETNTHFIGKFTPPKYRQFQYNTATDVFVSAADATATPTGNGSFAGSGAAQVLVTPDARLTKRQRWLKFHKIREAEPYVTGNAAKASSGRATVSITRQRTLRVYETPAVLADAIADIRPVEIKSVSASCVVKPFKASKARSGKAQPSCDSVLLAHGGSTAASPGTVVVNAEVNAVATATFSLAGSGVATVHAIRNPTDEELTAMVVEAVRRRRAQIIRSFK